MLPQVHHRRCAGGICDTGRMRLQPGMPPLSHLLALSTGVTLSLVVSLDGQLCGTDGSSRSISGPEDLDWLRRLRAASDAVVVGRATALAEGYRPIVTRAEYARERTQAGLREHPELVQLSRADDAPAVIRALGPRVLLEAGVRLHTALAGCVDRLWLSHSPSIVGTATTAFAFPLQGFALAERWCGEEFAFSRFERVSRR